MFSSPTLADIDADGDLDLFLGKGDGSIAFFENQGTAVQPDFVLVEPSWKGIDPGDWVAPAFGDIDADGDLDLILGRKVGVLAFYENLGTAEAEAITFVTLGMDDCDGNDIDTDGADFFGVSTPNLIDIDDDGDLDLLIGEGGIFPGGVINVYENQGSPQAPCFRSVGELTDSSGDVIELGETQDSAPAMGDCDGDGDLDLVIGRNDGLLCAYENTAGPAALALEEVTCSYLGIDVSFLSRPALADVDADGDLDLFVGAEDGTLIFFENGGTENVCPLKFTDITASSPDVARFRHFGDFAAPGVALADWDRDGDDDLYLPNGPGLANGLFRNNGDATFTTVPGAMGAGNIGQGLSPVFGDIDNDGDLDLFVANLNLEIDAVVGVFKEPDGLYLNQLMETGTASFIDITTAAGVGHPGGSMAALMLDYDLDGLLDIYVGTWLGCGDTNPLPNGLPPGESNLLFHNDGDPDGDGIPSFTDVTQAAGVSGLVPGFDPANSLGRSLFAVMSADLNRDAYPDIYVGTDSVLPDNIFLNNRDGTFTDIGLAAGGIGDDASRAMGIAIADINADQLPDIYVTDTRDMRLPGEFLGNPLYLSQGLAQDSTPRYALAPQASATSADFSWGTNFADFDNDGYLDLFVATNAESSELMYHNDGDGTFTEVGRCSGFGAVHDSRGTAVSDLDGDGDLDIVVGTYLGIPRIFRNDTENDYRQLTLRLNGTLGNRDAIGAVVTVTADVDRDETSEVLTREISAGGSHSSMSTLVVHVGIGSALEADHVLVEYPLGARYTIDNVQAGSSIDVDESLGIRTSAPPTIRPTATPPPTQVPTPIDSPTPASEPCAGDCNGDHAVNVGELIRAVNIAIGTQSIGDCSAIDTDRNGSVSIAELVAAVRNALDGC